MPSDAAAIQLDSVSHRFGDLQVLNELNLEVQAGQWVALLGESGCGKSTLLRLIAGLDTPDSGSISLLGQNQSSVPPHRRQVALVTQTAGCYDHLSVSENLLLAMRLAHPQPETKDRFVDGLLPRLIEQFQLDHVLENRPTQLSGGERQRLAIARGLLTRRPILLLDEPLAHLNETMRESLRRILREWTRRLHVTTLYVTHDAIEAMEIADRIAILNQGCIEQIGAPKSLYEAPRSSRVAQLFGRPSIQFLADKQASRTATEPIVGVRPVDWVASLAGDNDGLGVWKGDAQSAPEVVGVVINSVRVEANMWVDVDAGLVEPIRFTVPFEITTDTSRAGLWTPGTKLRLRARHWHRWPTR